MYTVIGITGKTGGTAARALLANGQKVRGIVRNVAKAIEWRERGAEIVAAELSDKKQMARALEGSEGVYIMLPTYFEAQDMFAENTRDLDSLKHAVVAAGIRKVVFLSSIGAEREIGTGAILKLHAMEEAFSSLPIATAAIRAGWFMENFHGLIPSARETGVLWSFLDPLNLRVPMIATKDIGTLAAELLQQAWSGHRVIELAAEPALSPLDVASVFSKIFGREIKAAIVPRDQWIPTYQSWGLTPRSAEAMAEMIEGFNSHWIAFGNTSAERVIAATTLEQVLQEAVDSTQG
ncbi:NAD(P)H-binding protein [Granulicella sp. 5B5]|uniref:NmrA family NAD(P)-binding protein n=1 Tax=Granulicella sp. 5B5 TaxID=1617967 RepID=UPI0015F734D6|nr:NmrA family NAD(P)-binding protein [Granulicella sp. 5B5]QMV19730.1 NAD(P)H-binding protein [Granulicella sp. 5B5]